VRLDVLLEVLRPLERLLAEVAFVRLEGHVHADVRRNVVALDGGGTTVTPCALKIQVVCALATDMTVVGS